MISLPFLLLLGASTLTNALLTPQLRDLSPRQALTWTTSDTPISGTNNGYYYYWWSDNNAQEEVILGPGGEYNVTWTGNALPFLAGKGWNPGSAA